VLTFFGAYFPIVGSFVSGAVAALVALAANGPVSRSPSSA
jgi:predicted PurR-regulated permease PerM